MPGEAKPRSLFSKHARILTLVLALAFLSLFLMGASTPAAAVTITVPFSTTPVATADLDGNPATGSWSDAGNWTIPLENGASPPYGTAQLYAKHDNSSIYFRIDGYSDIPWQSATATHFWLGMQISPSGTSHHSSGTWEGAFFGLWDGASYTPMPTYPPAVVETVNFNRPPSENATNADYGFMGVRGSSAPYAFTAEWRRPLNAGGLALATDGTTPYHFFVTTETNTAGANGGNINHGQITNVNVMRLASAGGTSPPPASPPTVSFLAPASGATVNGVVAVTATASSSAGIAHVDLYADTTLLGSVTAAPYSVSWNTSAYVNGAHTLTAKAYDPSNNVGTASIPVTVDHSLAAVSILAPADHSVVRGRVTINVSATGPGGVDHVDFFVNDSPIGSSTDAPFSGVWDTGPFGEGIYVLRAEAWFGGGSAANGTVTVLVDRTPRLSAPAVAAAGPGALRVTWNASSGHLVAGYVVLRSGSPNGPFVALNAAPLRRTTYVDTGLVPGASYYYEIEALDVWGYPTPPSPPAGAATTASSFFDFTNLRWMALPMGAAVVLLILAVLIRRELRRRGEAVRSRIESARDANRGRGR